MNGISNGDGTYKQLSNSDALVGMASDLPNPNASITENLKEMIVTTNISWSFSGTSTTVTSKITNPKGKRPKAVSGIVISSSGDTLNGVVVPYVSVNGNYMSMTLKASATEITFDMYRVANLANNGWFQSGTIQLCLIY